MRITVIPSDGTISIDIESIANIPEQYLEWIPENVHAFQWYGDQNYGEIEYYFPLAEQKYANEIVNELGIWENAITTFNEVIKR